MNAMSLTSVNERARSDESMEEETAFLTEECSSEPSEALGGFFDRYVQTHVDHTHCGKETRDSIRLTVVKWFVPAFFAGWGMFLSMWLLHVGTYYYIREMDRFADNFHRAPHASTRQHSIWSYAVHSKNTSYGSLEDPLEAELGFQHVDLAMLDAAAATLPLTWGISVLYMADLQCWTKILTCNFFLSFFKGLFGMMTVMPDSAGWQACQDRLGEDNLHYFRHEVPKPEEVGPLSTWLDLLMMEFRGPKRNRVGSGVRWCADMMYSGHTYFTCLYALGLLELLRTKWKTRGHPTEEQRRSSANRRRMALIICAFLCFMQQSLEIYLVLRNRFHYTSDIVMAVLITFLFYTNSSICVNSKSWKHWDGHLQHLWGYSRMHADRHSALVDLHTKVEDKHVREWLEEHKEKYHLVVGKRFQPEGDILVPVCCVPFCFQHGIQHIISDHHYIEWSESTVKQCTMVEETCKKDHGGCIKTLRSNLRKSNYPVHADVV
eukprot:TRINITY_DN11846_c0_g1_i2.p1 TRINITY_DN11846_c0_g1~~TRINITY_DN11846_c0_g1_i2.p1  ORF type:complete len:491 (+),score=52.44 TRINITY_DN11846_c0_g1_i2:137-1609(+)